MCEKRGYPSKRAAMKANSQNGKNLHAYQCSECGYRWHVSSHMIYRKRFH